MDTAKELAFGGLPGSSFPSAMSGTSASQSHSIPSSSSGAFESSIPSAPSLSLPKGGGAIQGMGEKFDVNLCNGTCSTSIPIRISHSRGGFQPQLSLNYSSGGGNGPFGLGWSLSCSHITRKTSKGLPRYNDTGADDGADVFLLSDTEDLVPIFKRDAHNEILLDAKGLPTFDESIQNNYTVRRYSPRIEDSFLRIERWISLTDRNDIFWRTTTRGNVTTVFGRDDSSRIYDPSTRLGEKKRIFSWLATESYDSNGNAILYKYKAEDSAGIPSYQANEANRSDTSRSANRYPKRILYGNKASLRQMSTWSPVPASTLPEDAWMFSVVFDYGEHDPANPKPNEIRPWACRKDPFSSFTSCFEIRTYRLCQRILIFHHLAELGVADCLVNSTDLTYSQNGTVTYLESAALAGYTLNDTGESYTRQQLPPTVFEYSLFPTDEALSQLVVQDLDSTSLENAPVGLDKSKYQWVDLDCEGLAGLLTQQGESWFYKRNSSANNITPDDGDTGFLGKAKPRLDTLEMVSLRPSKPIGGPTHFGDVSGAMRLDLIQMESGSWGYFERSSDDGWTSFRNFSSFPNLDAGYSNMKFIDLTGDGLADILICADQVYTWYPSLGEDGYGEGQVVTQLLGENAVPTCIFEDSQLAIYFADMSGDGLADLVRVRNGDIGYWPNLGYGNFGAFVQMDNGPYFDSVETFHQKRIRLVDIDGSGTTDILYLLSDGVDLYLNQSGNGFANRRRLNSFPPTDDNCVVSTIDLLGNGTPCLVWSNAFPSAYPVPMRYLDIMQGKKPHLLTKITNNLGTTTRIRYAPSTKFYLEDKQNGTPWVTKLPFPVYCVEKLEVIDGISGNRFVKNYRYRHGYYDGFEREFRGFGMVEHWDTDNFASMSKIDSTNVDSSWHVPPIHTKTWFHTGAYFETQDVSYQLARDYFGAPSNGDKGTMNTFYNTLLEKAALPVGLSASQQREACRALKNHVLRAEVYADDGSSKAHIPYSIEQENFAVVAIQPLQDAKLHAVYFVHPREAITHHFERNIEDPRIQHKLTLEVDPYGNILRSLEVAYGRQPGKSSLSGNDKEKQQTTLVLYTESDFTNGVDDAEYRLPLCCEVRQYQLSGLQIPAGSVRFKLADFTADAFAVIRSMQEIPFEQEGSIINQQKRLMKRSRMIYRKDDLTGLLPLGLVQSMALPGITYDLAFTPGLLSSVFKRQPVNELPEYLIPDPGSVLGGIGEQQAGYVDLDGNGQWWKPAGKVLYIRDPSVEPTRELAEARAHFFTPRCFMDPFENSSFVDYDNYDMFPVLTEDSVGNTTSSVVDYRVLQFKLTTDSNGNRSAAAFDALGFVVGTAAMGKTSENIGDSLESFRPNLTQLELDQFYASPTGPMATSLLGSATTRIIYDPNRYWQHGTKTAPAYTATLVRETHVSDQVPPKNLKTKLSFAYSDGFGRTIQVKAHTKAGPLVDGGSPVDSRWITSGWAIFNNKGKPVKQYEPSFDDTHEFKYDMRIGVTPIIMYDPLLRVVAILHPDHTLERVLFDSWSQTSFDANDNVLISNPKNDPDFGHFFDTLPDYSYLPSWYDSRSSGKLGVDEQAAAAKTTPHSNTPRTAHFDALGQTILSINDNGAGEKIQTRFTVDILGNQREIVDAMNRVVIKYDYDIYGHQIHRASMEAGERWILLDVMGRSLLSWNSRKYRFRSVYDTCGRPIESWVREGNSDEALFERKIYGESAPDASAHNLRGKLYQIMDQAGKAESTEFDFKGNLQRRGRQLAKDYKNILDWSKPVPLETPVYQISATYDALNRPIQTTSADHSVTYRVYNETGHLDKTFVNIRGEQEGADPTTWTPFVTNVDYNPKDQMTRINYGNGVVSTYTYNAMTFRLQRRQSTRANPRFGNGQTTIQDLSYTYDPVGNITHIRDDAQQEIYFRGRRVEPSNDYTYDPLYRLTEARGREHLGQTNGQPTAPGPWSSAYTNIDHPSNGNAMGAYLETYSYDVAGNISTVSHRTTDPAYPGWKRGYNYNEPSQLEPGKKNNRLSSTTLGNATENYAYLGSAALHGNITGMSHLLDMQWDFHDQLHSTTKQTVNNGGTPETTYYVYDSTGNRIRKVTESQSGAGGAATPTVMNERLYLGAVELYRKYGGTGADPADNISLERVSLSITDSQERRVSIVEIRTRGTEAKTPQQLTRYQLSNHLGSATIELTEDAEIISYEEYFPLGATSYHAVATGLEIPPKRYRYTGKELDSSSGLYYYGARYYASWLGRWVSCDPGGLIDGANLYEYVKNNSIRMLDATGLAGEEGENETPKGGHKKNTRKSTKDDHEDADARRKREQEKRKEKEKSQRRKGPKEDEAEKRRRENEEREKKYREKAEKDRKERERDPEQEKRERERQRREEEWKRKEKEHTKPEKPEEKPEEKPKPNEKEDEKKEQPEQPQRAPPQPDVPPTPVHPPVIIPIPPVPTSQNPPVPTNPNPPPNQPNTQPTETAPSHTSTQSNSSPSGLKIPLYIVGGAIVAVAATIATLALTADDATGIGVADDAAIPATGSAALWGANLTRLGFAALF